MSEKSIIKYKIGDCIAAENGIGKIVDLVYNEDNPSQKEFKIDFILLAGSVYDVCGEKFVGGVVRQWLYLSPMEVSRDFPPASEKDWAKAVVLMSTCETSFRSILYRYDGVKSGNKDITV